jgi:hypothetical protein
MRPVRDGGAGFEGRADAERLAGARSLEELQHWIRLAQKRGARSISGFIYRAITNGDAPPESFLRAQKDAYAGTIPILDGIVQPMAEQHRAPRQNVRQEVGPPPGWDDGDEREDEEEAPRRPALRKRDPDRPNCLAYLPFRGHRG